MLELGLEFSTCSMTVFSPVAGDITALEEMKKAKDIEIEKYKKYLNKAKKIIENIGDRKTQGAEENLEVREGGREREGVGRGREWGSGEREGGGVKEGVKRQEGGGEKKEGREEGKEGGREEGKEGGGEGGREPGWKGGGREGGNASAYPFPMCLVF